MLRATLIIICTFFLLTFLNAQDFGGVNEAELRMTKFENDPVADAVILYEKGEISITENFNLKYHVYRKIKILTEKGKQYADIKIRYWHEDEINDLEAQSTSPSGEETELDDNNIIKIETDRTNEIDFTVPGVEVGSVIEYQYEKFSEYITSMKPWLFQHPIYTVSSNLDVDMPAGFTYYTLTTGFNNYNIYKKQKKIINPYDPQKKLVKFSFSGKNLQGLKDEPYVDNIYDEYTKIIFMLKSYKDLYTYFVLSKSWDDLSKRFSKFYKPFLDSNFDSDPVISKILQEEKDPLVLAKKAYNFVADSIKTSGHENLTSRDFKPPEKVLRDKSGSSVEKNILLISILKRAGIKAEPIFISTRNNGKFNAEFHDADQFNRIVCYAKINNSEYFLYPIDKYNPFGYLTPATSVGEGLLLIGEKSAIKRLNPFLPFNRTSYKTVCNLTDNLNLTGDTKITYEGYSALKEREELDGKTKEQIKDFVKDKISDFSEDAVLDTFYYANMDSIKKPLELNIKYTLPNYLSEAAGLVYFTAPFYTAISKNPFVREKRLFPIDYDYKETVQEKVEMDLPKDFTPNDIPQSIGGSIKELSFTKFNSTIGNKIDSERDFILHQRKIPFNHYKELKKLYDKIVTSDQEQIILSKTTSKEIKIGQ